LKTLFPLVPFVLFLMAVAVLPWVSTPWWGKNGNKLIVSSLGAGSGVLLYLHGAQDPSLVWRVFLEYGAFIALLAALFVVSGGIHISGAFAGFPFMNTLFLLTGAVFSNYLGTTGASLLLVRPLLRANKHRQHKTHLFVFFIFIVANCGGLLAPLGDPPLYLGFLHGVPFLWTFRLLPHWALVTFILLFIFHVMDEYYFRKEELSAKENLAAEIGAAHRAFHVKGRRNILLLGVVLAVVLFSGYSLNPWLAQQVGRVSADSLCDAFQMVFLSVIAWVSFKATSPRIHIENSLHFAPMQEVAILFFGVFGTMIPALAFLQSQAAGLNLTEPWQYFWTSGLLSGFLDSAPAYLSFATLAAARGGFPPGQWGLLAEHSPRILQAISCGTVWMGALTYVGNGPNLMVKAVAEHMGVKMPSFGGFLVWSLAVMVPVLVLATFVFF
jgi:Na+/H+ antiporter NhaD/arsenite permease-like protein